MDGPTDREREADLDQPRALDVDGREQRLIDGIATFWRESGSWPTRQRVVLERRGEGIEGVLAALEGQFLNRTSDGRLMLTLAGLEKAAGAGEEVAAFLALVRLAASRYIENPFAALQVGRSDLVRILGGERSADVERLGHYYQSVWFGSWSSTADGDWYLEPGIDHVRMERVATGWEYQQNLRPRWRGEMEELESVHVLLLRSIYDRWHAEGEWPQSARVVVEERRHGDVLTLLREVSHRLLQGRETHGTSTERYVLRLDGVNLVAPGAETELFVRLLGAVLEHHVATLGERAISAEEIADRLGISTPDVRRLKEFIRQERLAGVRLMTSGESWSVMGMEEIIRWEGVTSYAAYAERRQELEQRELPAMDEELSALGEALDRQEHLDARDLHPVIDSAARAHFLAGQFRSAVLDASIALTNQVKERAGEPHLDGSKLMSNVFSPDEGMLQIRPILTDFDREEQRGWMQLFLGTMAAIRNPAAHSLNEPKLLEALDRLSLLSLLCRRLDRMEDRTGGLP